MKKVYYNWKDIEAAVIKIGNQMRDDNWHPDYIVGLTRGGLSPAVLLSQYTGVPMHTLKVSLRDEHNCESNLWMAEDAFNGKRILIVDDINDTGATLAWIKEDWQSSCSPKDQRWRAEGVFGTNVRIAAIVDNMSSNERIHYPSIKIDKSKEDCWVSFPWEEFWIK